MSAGGIAKTIATGVRKVVSSKKFLFAIGIIGIGTTVVTTGVGTALAEKHVREAKEEKIRKTAPEDRSEVKLTRKEIVAAVYKDYIPCAASATLTIVSFSLLFNKMSKENAAIHGLLSVSEATVQRLQDKMIADLGEKKGNAAITEAYNEVAKDNPPTEVKTSPGYLDDVNPTDVIYVCNRIDNRTFKSTKMILQKAVEQLNLNLRELGETSLNDFYESCGQTDSDIGYIVKWISNSINDYKIDLMWDKNWNGAYVDDDGRAWTYLRFTVEPTVGFIE